LLAGWFDGCVLLSPAGKSLGFTNTGRSETIDL
jgi:hypothetical protein